MSDLTASATAGRKPLFSDGYKSAVLGLLVVAYTFNFIDRTIIATIGQAIKLDLKLTDQDLGWLGGFSFAILYTTLGIPIARLAERRSRVSIISLAVLIWSGFTAACGLAQSFVQLLALRVGVGVGEAGLSPPSHSLISDYYEPKKRASALSIYSFGIPLGTMFGAVAGGWIAQHLGWRQAFLLVGAPGLLIAMALKLFIREPPRGHSETGEPPPLSAEDVTAAAAAASDHWLVTEFKELAFVGKRVFGRWGFFHMAAGITVASFASYGVGQYQQPYFIRNFGLSYSQVGLIFGLIGGVSTGAGTLIGGFLTDWAGKRSKRWYALVPAIGIAIACPLYILVFTRPDWRLAAGLLLIPGVFHYTYLGPTFGVIQNAVDTRRRATATALLFFALNLIALGFGPPFCGWTIDRFSAHLFAASHMGDFFAMCPGGIGLKGAGAGVDVACKAAIAHGTRSGIVVNLLIYAWASAHYFLAAITLPKDLAAAAAERGEA